MVEDESAILGDETAATAVPGPAAASSGRVEMLSRQVMQLHSMIREGTDPMVQKGGKKHPRPQTPAQVCLRFNPFIV